MFLDEFEKKAGFLGSLAKFPVNVAKNTADQVSGKTGKAFLAYDAYSSAKNIKQQRSRPMGVPREAWGQQ
jgi:hypothetical protein